MLGESLGYKVYFHSVFVTSQWSIPAGICNLRNNSNKVVNVIIGFKFAAQGFMFEGIKGRKKARNDTIVTFY